VALTKKLFIKTYGCQMNVYDSARMADALAADGYRRVEDPGDANIVVLNTCHIREKAAEKVYSELGRLRRYKEREPSLIIAVGGCVAQAEGAEVQRRAPFVDVVFGPQTYHRLPELIKRAAVGKVRDTDFPVESKFDHLPEESSVGGISAYLSVQEGCDKFCTFCVVPYTRGAEYSRPVAEILAEARRLINRGAREITLLGQNVNAFHGEGPTGTDWSLARLICALAELDGLWRIRYTTSHPRDMADDLIATHGLVPQLMPFLHLPVQSGSDRILAAMNRRHDRTSYLRLVERLIAAREDLALSGDFIVGFPGETDEDFDATLSLVRQVGYAQAYSFRYSSRPGTPAAEKPQVPEVVKAERLRALQSALDMQQEEFNAAMVGRIVPVLFEGAGRHPGQQRGKSPYGQMVHVAAPHTVVGRIANVRISEDRGHGLAGTLQKAAMVPTTRCVA
jgi:tRNA-2-methylthio-N6-dimethylallyladenosine synthase